MAERLIAPVLKTGVGVVSMVGSNPTPSAGKRRRRRDFASRRPLSLQFNADPLPPAAVPVGVRAAGKTAPTRPAVVTVRRAAPPVRGRVAGLRLHPAIQGDFAEVVPAGALAPGDGDVADHVRGGRPAEGTDRAAAGRVARR